MDWRAGCTVQFVLALRSLTCSPSAKGLRCQVFDLRPPEAHVEANYKSEGPDELHANLFQQVPQARRKKGRGEMFCVTIFCARLCDSDSF